MRDALDQVTAELPAFPPMPRAPEREPRTNVAERKRLANYTPPKQVESCRNCKHVRATMQNPDSLYEHETHGCSKNRFGVQLGAIYDDYVGRRA